MKKFVLMGFALCAVLAMTSCKPTESAYKQAYEKAKSAELAQEETTAETTPVVADVPVIITEKSTVATPVVRSERVTAVDGATMQEFNVVVGSFGVKANADNLIAQMKSQGFPAFSAFNASNKMYRVIIGTFANRNDAAIARDNFKAKFPTREDFQKAWLLQRAL
ncbi:MAG: SPOR domain-containing protein [Bacteroidaceae bacterium]|nr:SPOR domain-containing protein [Bacteroidaceae bacterium]